LTERQRGAPPRMPYAPPPPPQPVPPQPFYGNMPPQDYGNIPPQVMPGMMPPQAGMSPVRVPYSQQELSNIGRDVILQILRRMRIQARTQIQLHQPMIDPATGEDDDSPVATINLVGGDLAVLIGRRGEALTDLQYIFNLIMNKKTRTWGKVMLDVEGYRTRRKENLVMLARRMADQVMATRQPITLEPMPAHERRLVHITLLDHPYIRTESFGEGEERKVTLFPK
jgi:spoIIIJ-associated protein